MITKRKFMNFMRSFTPYQICYLCTVVAMTLLFVIFLPDEMLEDTSNTFVLVCSVIAVMANPVCELLISKQSKWNFAVDFVFIELTELMLYLSLGYYTMAAITVLFWVPADIISFVTWNRHPDREREELTQVKRLTWGQDVLAVLAIAVFSIGTGSVIRLIPGAESSYLEAFCSAFGVANGILLLLRYNEQWYAWFITLVLYAVLYISSGSYIMLITVAAMLVNTCYGFAKWLKYTKTHKNSEAAGAKRA